MKCLIPYGANGYSTDDDCMSNQMLICNNASSLCECQRSFNDEFYWNGTSCQPSLSYGQSCLNSTTSYMCQTLTQGTICSNTNSSVYTCQCPISKYFENMTNMCQNELLFNQSCNINKVCKSQLGLVCLSGICK